MAGRTCGPLGTGGPPGGGGPPVREPPPRAAAGAGAALLLASPPFPANITLFNGGNGDFSLPVRNALTC